jgi:hypothetical protein
MSFFINDGGKTICVKIEKPLKDMTLKDIARTFIRVKDISVQALANFSEAFWVAVDKELEKILGEELALEYINGKSIS